MLEEDKQPDIDLSDSLPNEEFMANFNKMMVEGSENNQATESEEEVVENEEVSEENQDSEDTEADNQEVPPTEGEEEESTPEDKPKKQKAGDDNKNTKPTEDSKDKQATNPDANPESSDALYKDTYDKLFGQPIKASGRSIQLKTVDEVISLVQKGLDYTKKSQGLAEARKTHESLNKAEIDESRLALLIDIHKGDKEALKSLVKSSKIDPTDLLDLDDSPSDYKPKTRLLSDADIKLSDVVEFIDQSEHKDEVWKIVRDKKHGWDTASYDMMMKDPNLILALNHEMETGRFKTLQENMDRERAIGSKRASSLNDLQLCMELAYEMDQAEKAKSDVQKENIQRPIKQKAEKRNSVSISGNRGSSSVSGKNKLQGLTSISDDKKYLEEFYKNIST